MFIRTFVVGTLVVLSTGGIAQAQGQLASLLKPANVSGMFEMFRDVCVSHPGDKPGSVQAAKSAGLVPADKEITDQRLPMGTDASVYFADKSIDGPFLLGISQKDGDLQCMMFALQSNREQSLDAIATAAGGFPGKKSMDAPGGSVAWEDDATGQKIALVADAGHEGTTMMIMQAPQVR